MRAERRRRLRRAILGILCYAESVVTRAGLPKRLFSHELAECLARGIGTCGRYRFQSWSSFNRNARRRELYSECRALSLRGDVVFRRVRTHATWHIALPRKAVTR